MSSRDLFPAKILQISDHSDEISFPFYLSSTGRRSFQSASALIQKDAIRRDVFRNRWIHSLDWDPWSAKKWFQRQKILERISKFSWIVIQNGENDSHSMVQIR
jgi:hypothetical protein